MPDGSLVLLVDTGKGSPAAVGLLGSEGETDSVATSLEEFLILLSNAETGISDLDEIQIKQARELTARWESRPLVGLLVAWLAGDAFLEPKAFLGHEALLEGVRKRKERGSKLVEAALPRGLWDIHLKDLPGFRDFAYGWMHNIGGMFIRDDLVSVFGSREGPYGHQEAVLDDDDWQAVDKATPVLDRRFAGWTAKKK